MEKAAAEGGEGGPGRGCQGHRPQVGQGRQGGQGAAPLGRGLKGRQGGDLLLLAGWGGEGGEGGGEREGQGAELPGLCEGDERPAVGEVEDRGGRFLPLRTWEGEVRRGTIIAAAPGNSP